MMRPLVPKEEEPPVSFLRNRFAEMTGCVTSNLLISISLCSTSSFWAQFKWDIFSDTVTAE